MGGTNEDIKKEWKKCLLFLAIANSIKRVVKR